MRVSAAIRPAWRYVTPAACAARPSGRPGSGTGREPLCLGGRESRHRAPVLCFANHRESPGIAIFPVPGQVLARNSGQGGRVKRALRASCGALEPRRSSQQVCSIESSVLRRLTSRNVDGRPAGRPPARLVRGSPRGRACPCGLPRGPSYTHRARLAVGQRLPWDTAGAQWLASSNIGDRPATLAGSPTLVEPTPR